MRDIAEELHDEWMKAGHHTDDETLKQLLVRAVKAGYELAKTEAASEPEAEVSAGE